MKKVNKWIGRIELQIAISELVCSVVRRKAQEGNAEGGFLEVSKLELGVGVSG